MAERDRFRLNIVGADEDVPRLLLVYGKGCGGEVAFVFRPREGEGVLVHQKKGVPALVWVRNLDQLPEGVRPSVAGKLESDGPRAPAWSVGASEAVSLIKRLKANPPKTGPATLRGTWKGELRCAEMQPFVHLERKVAAYGTLHVDSDANGRWTARFERSEKWFSTAKQDRTPPYDSLGEAIQRGMVQMTGLVSEACSFRDTRRRNTVDPTYAEQHPYRAPREGKDPTERYSPRARYTVSEGAAGWSVLNDAGAVVAAFGAREKGKAREYASALNRGESPPPPQPAAPPEPKPPKVKREPTEPKPDRKSRSAASEVPALKDVASPEPPSCPTSVAKIAAATEKEAQALEDLSGSLWGTTEGPELLRRAAKLIRHAESLVRSPLCKGSEQKAAWEELKKAADAYSKAREALQAGQSKTVTTELRRIAERVSLAAARAAKACGQGAAAGSGGGSKARSRPRAETPAPVETPPSSEAPKKRGGRKPKEETDKSTAEKDAILMAAFSNAIAAAVQQMQAGGGA